MKINNFLFFLFFLFSLAPFTGQCQKHTSHIVGKIIEPESRISLTDVNVVLYSKKDSLLVKGTLTDENGLFKLSGLTKGSYYLECSFIGFKKDKVDHITINSDVELIDVGVIKMATDILELNEVELIATKKTFTNSIDRKVYNVGQDIMAQSNSVTEILNNIPAISVDIDGQISLRGTSNITFFINGRPSTLMRLNSTMALQQIPASTIERIEIITNPSAKYKPDGIGGIINIVLKKDKKIGVNGALIANVGNYNRYNTTLSMNYNTGKTNIYGNYGFRNTTKQKLFDEERTLKNSNGQVESFYKNNSKTFDKDRSHILSGGLDYNINDNSQFNISGNIFLGKDQSDSFETTKTHDKNGVLLSEFNSINTEEDKEIEAELSTTYELDFGEDKTLSINANYANYKENEDVNFNDDYITPENQSLFVHNATQKNGPKFDFYAQYTTPVKAGEIETGYSYELFRDNIDFFTESKTSINQDYEENPDRANLFVFNQQIHALFITYKNTIGKLNYMAGLRSEQALISSNLKNLDSTINNNYFKAYPTLHLSYVLDEQQQIQLNYSHRVNRADSDEHNPYPDYKDTRTIEVGNPKLKPEQIHSIELGYELKSNKYSFIPSVYYRYKYNGFTRINSIVNDSILLKSYVNLSNEEALGAEIILSSSIGKSVDLNLNFNGYYNEIDVSNLELSEPKSAFSWNTKLFMQARLTPSTNFQINSTYQSSRITAQGSKKPTYVFSCGAAQSFLDRRASLTLTISDVFNTLRSETEINTITLEQQTRYKRQSQIIYLGFRYNFGHHLKSDPNEINFDDQL